MSLLIETVGNYFIDFWSRPEEVVFNADYFINSAKNMDFHPGEFFRAIGPAEPIKDVQLRKIDANRHYVNGDGSCWARATWQCVFSQIFSHEPLYHQFLRDVANSSTRDPLLVKLAHETIHILNQLKDKTPEERVIYLNHKNVDDSLIFFMRHIAANFMETHYSIYSPEEIEAIKAQKNKYGSTECTSFIKHFNLEMHTISKSSDGQWKHYFIKNGVNMITPIQEINSAKNPLRYHCLFGASPRHFEFVSFNSHVQPHVKPITQPQVNQSLDALAKQIKEDFKLAQKIQEEFNEAHRANQKQILADRQLAQTLQASARQKEIEKTFCTAPARSSSQTQRTKTKQLVVNHSLIQAFWSKLSQLFAIFFEFLNFRNKNKLNDQID